MVSLVPTEQTDIKFALELGVAIMLDKPIIAVVRPGTRVPAKLVAVADELLEMDLDNPVSTQASLRATLKRVMRRRT